VAMSRKCGAAFRNATQMAQNFKAGGAKAKEAFQIYMKAGRRRMNLFFVKSNTDVSNAANLNVS